MRRPCAAAMWPSSRCGHGVDRIEVMGTDAVVVGGDDRNLYFSAVPLKDRPSLGDRYVLQGAAQAETRSHGFFFSPDAGGDSGAARPSDRASGTARVRGSSPRTQPR